MARKRAHVPLNVFLNSRLVGVLRRESTGAIDFQYGRDWLDWRGTFPVSLSLPLREDRYIGAPVINVFDNLLPDSDAIRKRVAERVGADGTDAYSLLTALGHDCVGALQFLPDGTDPGTAGDTDGKPVTDDDVADIINNLAAAPLGMGEDEDFRISIAGAQEKTALLRKNGQWFKPAGTTATTHILKPQIGQLPNGIDLSNSVENEYLCLKLLAALGVPAANRDRRFRGTPHTDRRTLRPPLDKRRPPAAPAARRYLPGPLGPAHAQIPVRRRPRHARHHPAPERQRHAGSRHRHLHARLHPVLDARRDRRSREELQHYPRPRRTLPPDPALRRADRAAEPRCRPNPAQEIQARHVRRQEPSLRRR